MGKIKAFLLKLSEMTAHVIIFNYTSSNIHLSIIDAKWQLEHAISKISDLDFLFSSKWKPQKKVL
jgi:hypothetical protein